MRAAAFLLPSLLVAGLAADGAERWPDGVALAVLAVGGLTVAATFLTGRLPRGWGAWLLGTLALWALSSGVWSDSWGRAFAETDRTVLYALVVAAAGALAPWKDEAVDGLALALVGIAAATIYGAAVGDFDIPLEDAEAAGPAAALGVLLCLVCGARRPVPAAAALPLLGAALWLSQSRFAVLGLAAGIAILAVLGSRRQITALLLVAAPGAAIVVLAGAAGDPVGTAEDPALLVPLVAAACCALSAIAATRTGAVEERLPRESRRTPAVLVGGLLLLCVPILAIAPDRPGVVSATLTGSVEGRKPVWRAALGAWDDAPLRGTGAGTFPIEWDARRRIDDELGSAYSLPLETAAELGAVGLVLLGAALTALVAGLVRRRREPAAALALAGLAAWAPEALTDRTWDVVAVTVVPFALAGLAMGTRRAGRGRIAAPVVVTAWLVVAGTLALSDRWLGQSRDRLGSGDLTAAVVLAEDARDVRPEQPEAYALAAYAYARAGQPAQARRAARLAAERDPRAWTWRYTRAIAEASAGADPVPFLVAAQRADPRNRFITRLIERSVTLGPDARRDLARSAPALTSP